MIDDHGIKRRYTHAMSFNQAKWDRIFGRVDDLRKELRNKYCRCANANRPARPVPGSECNYCVRPHETKDVLRSKIPLTNKMIEDMEADLKEAEADNGYVREIFGLPVVVSDDLEEDAVIVFGGFDDLGKPIATKIINTGAAFLREELREEEINKCTAIAKNGNRCKNPPMPWNRNKTCWVHGKSYD